MCKKIRFHHVIVCGFMLLLYSTQAFADASSLDPTEMAQHILDFLTGNFGKVIATLAFVFTGIGSMIIGKFSRGWFYGVCAGIIIVFGSGALLNTITG